jgi:hypothetical protein
LDMTQLGVPTNMAMRSSTVAPEILRDFAR